MTDQPLASIRCTATSRRTGEQCNNWAMRGLGVCRMHGGASKRSKAAAKRRLAEQAAAKQVAKFGARRDIHPAEALLELVHWTAGEVCYWREVVTAVEAEQGPRGLVWGVTKEVEREESNTLDTTRAAGPSVAYGMLTDASDRLAAYASAALKAGVDERRVQLAESQGRLVAGVIRAVLARLELSEGQRVVASQVVPEELRRLSVEGVRVVT